jgi:RNA polymerase sigma-70 factor, ECF subfamily
MRGRVSLAQSPPTLGSAAVYPLQNAWWHDQLSRRCHRPSRTFDLSMTSAVQRSGAPPPDDDEPALVALVKRGSSDAFGQLVERHLPRAYRVAWRLMRHREEAEDVVQDAFVRALERIDQCEDGRAFGPWFFRIVATTAINRQRSAKRRGTEELTNTEVSEAIGPDDAAVAGALQEDVRSALDRLTPVQRQLIELISFDGFSPTEAAALLEMPAGTARWHLHEARKQLRMTLQVWLDDDGEDV